MFDTDIVPVLGVAGGVGGVLVVAGSVSLAAVCSCTNSDDVSDSVPAAAGSVAASTDVSLSAAGVVSGVASAVV